MSTTHTQAAKITVKGQVTIPKEIRAVLNTDVVVFKLIDNVIILESVNTVSGSLNRYAKKYTPLKEIRDSVWNEVINEKFGRQTP